MAEGKIKLNSEHIRSGYTMRQVQCTKVIDMKKGTVTVTRNDTGDIVLARNLTEEEKQFQLNLDS